MKVRSQIGPFSIVPEWVMDRDLSATALKLYVTLGRFADYDSGVAFPSRETLAARMSCSEKTVDRAVTELEESECIEVWAVSRYASKRYRVLQVDPRGLREGTFLSDEETDLAGEETNLSVREDTDVHLTRTNKRESINNNHLTKRRPKTADDYEPSSDRVEKWEEEFPGVRIDIELKKFKDYYMAAGRTWKDYNRAFANWLRRASEYSPEARAARVQAEEEAKWKKLMEERGME